MPTIIRPMLAQEVIDADLHLIQFPVLVSIKHDGIRARKIDGVLYSRQHKPIPNRHIQKVCAQLYPDNVEMEIVATVNDWDAPFEATESAVMTRNSKPTFRVYVFDWFGKPSWPLQRRLQYLRGAGCFPVHQTFCSSLATLQKAIQQSKYTGIEGFVIRDPMGRYKQGRSTLNEQGFLKYKYISDEEGIIIGTVPFRSNAAKSTINAFGLKEKTKRKSDQVEENKLGAFIVQTPEGQVVEIGSGFSEKQRLDFWKKRATILDKSMTYTFRGRTRKGKPKHATFKCIRQD